MNKNMKALVKTAAAPKNLEIQQVLMPELKGPKDVLIKIHKTL